MEELKILVDMVAKLPQMALWVIFAFFLYKMSILASVYGVIRYTVGKMHDWAITKKLSPQEIVKEGRDIYYLTVNEAYDPLLKQLNRLTSSGMTFIHKNDVEYLKELLDTNLPSREQKEKR